MALSTILIITGILIFPFNVVLGECNTNDFDGALSCCANIAEQLPVLDTLQKFQSYTSFLKNINQKESWTALRRYTFETFKWTSGKLPDETFLQQTWPKGKSCGVLDIRENTFAASDCDKSEYGRLCEENGITDCMCDESTYCIPLGHRCFYIECTPSTWHEAFAICHRHGRRLAVFDYANATHDIFTINSKWYDPTSPCTKVWIGLRKQQWFHSLNKGKKPVTEIFWDIDKLSKTVDCALVTRGPHKFVIEAAACNITHNYTCQPQQNDAVVESITTGGLQPIPVPKGATRKSKTKGQDSYTEQNLPEQNISRIPGLETVFMIAGVVAFITLSVCSIILTVYFVGRKCARARPGQTRAPCSATEPAEKINILNSAKV